MVGTQVPSAHRTQQLRLKDKLPFFVLLAALVGLIVLPPYRLLALLAYDVPHDVSSRGHASLVGLARLDIDYIVEEVGFPVLASEVLLKKQSTPPVLVGLSR